MKLFFQIILKITFILTLFIGCATTEEIKENDPVALVKQSIAFIEEGQNDRAISYCNKAIKINPSYSEAYNTRGRSYYGKHQYDKAISDYNEALNINPLQAAAYNNRGIIYGSKGQYDKAIYDFNKALDVDPRDFEAHLNRGRAYKEKHQYDKAISNYNKAVDINPRYFRAYNNKAWILATCPDNVYRDGAKAVELAKKALELDKKDRIKNMILDTLAAAYAEAGRFEDAIITQEEVIVLLKKEGKPTNMIKQCIERLNYYKAHKPWREK